MLKDRLEDSVVVIGNAPSVLLTVCGFVDVRIHPALVVDTPVEFVNAAESKEVLSLGGTDISAAQVILPAEFPHLFLRLGGTAAGRHGSFRGIIRRIVLRGF